jgi:hypothetical protein
MSTTKKLLKQARESLGKKEYREALLHCKSALQEDKNCYEAYLYVGKAAYQLQEYQQVQPKPSLNTASSLPLDPAVKLGKQSYILKYCLFNQDLWFSPLITTFKR